MTAASAQAAAAVASIGIDEEYGDMHRIVLQGILSAGYLNARGVKRLFAGACNYLKLPAAERTTMPYVQKLVREINERLRTFDMAIKSASCELTGKKYYIFLITVEKPIMKLQTLFSRFEMELFQKCMDKMLRAYNNFSVPIQECIALSKDINEPKGSVELGRAFIEKMIESIYFAKYVMPDGESNLTLGIRALREFEPLLREMYHDVVTTCSLCNTMMLHGYLCPECKILLHMPCYTRFIVENPQCPRCFTPWGDDVEMIQRVRQEPEQEVEQDFGEQEPDEEEEDAEDPSMSPIRDVRSVETQPAEEDEDVMPLLQPMGEVRLGKKSRKSKKKKKSKSRARVSSEEEEESE
jgi:Zn-finger nucleic acid-binding protein